MPFSSEICPFQSPIFMSPNALAMCYVPTGNNANFESDPFGPNPNHIGYQTGVALRTCVIDPLNNMLSALSGKIVNIWNGVSSFFSQSHSTSIFASAYELDEEVDASETDEEEGEDLVDIDIVGERAEIDSKTGKVKTVLIDGEVTYDKDGRRTITTSAVKASQKVRSIISGRVTGIDGSIGRKQKKATPVLKSKTTSVQKSKESAMPTKKAKERSNFGKETVDHVKHSSSCTLEGTEVTGKV